MQPFNFIIENFLKGKETYPVLRRIVNLLLSLSITSYFFEWIYYPYEWLDITDYKAITDFFIKGFFIIPLLLFVTIHWGIQQLAYVFLVLTVQRKTARWIEKLSELKVKKTDLLTASKVASEQLGAKLSKEERLTWVARLYQYLKASVDPIQWSQIERKLGVQQAVVKSHFFLLVRLAIALTIYIFVLPHFGLALYVVATILTLAGLSILWYGYLILEILPVVVRKVDLEMQQHVPPAANTDTFSAA